MEGSGSGDAAAGPGPLKAILRVDKGSCLGIIGALNSCYRIHVHFAYY